MYIIYLKRIRYQVEELTIQVEDLRDCGIRDDCESRSFRYIKRTLLHGFGLTVLMDECPSHDGAATNEVAVVELIFIYLLNFNST
jgi:hypothetical protein